MHGALSIYVHYPYCSRICTFCNFNKYLLTQDVNHQALFSSYQRELSFGLKRYRATDAAKTVRSVYFGGGTPSLAPGLVPAVLQTISECGYKLEDDCEITLEANPSSLPDLQRSSDEGVTRISLGVQSLTSAEHLAFFNREHDTRQAFSALEHLAKTRSFFKHGYTFDILFGNPVLNGNVKTSVYRELEFALPFTEIGGHLSLYELTVAQGTPLARRISNKIHNLAMPGQDARADEFEAADAFFTDRKWHHYEISSFARSAFNIGRHNFAFWMGAPLLGIGPGAHGRLPVWKAGKMSQLRTRNVPEPKRWSSQVDAVQHGCAKEDTLTVDDFADEMIALGLRTSAGVSASRFRQLLVELGSDKTLDDFLDSAQVARLIEHGLLSTPATANAPASVPSEWSSIHKNGYIRATTAGRLVLDTMLPHLFKSHKEE